MSIVVFGSINMDLVVRASSLPVPGQTIHGQTFFTAPGGKGANQAVAAARLGFPVRMVGNVGDDVFAATLRESMRKDAVDVANVAGLSGTPSGVALITVAEGGENTIIVVAGANGAYAAHDLERLDQALHGARVILLQLEIPLEMVLNAAERAHRAGVTVILDPAPAQPLPATLYPLIDVITPNESEAETLVGFPIHNTEDAARAGHLLIERGVRRAVVKMGSRGAYWVDSVDQREGHMPAFAVEAVDTVAAGDAFNGGLAAALYQHIPFREAVRWGAAAGALSTTHIGAQPSMPTRQKLMSLLR